MAQFYRCLGYLPKINGLLDCSVSKSGLRGIPFLSWRSKIAVKPTRLAVTRYIVTATVVPVASTKDAAIIGANAPPRIDPMA